MEKALSERAEKYIPAPRTVPSTTNELKELMERTLTKVTVLEAQLTELRRNENLVHRGCMKRKELIEECPKGTEISRKARQAVASEQPKQTRHVNTVKPTARETGSMEHKDENTGRKDSLQERLRKGKMLIMKSESDLENVIPLYFEGYQR